MHRTGMLYQEYMWEELKMKKLLITGANGLIASTLIDELMKNNQSYGLESQIYALCRTRKKGEKRFADYINDECFHLVVQDITQPISTTVDFDYIIHAASYAYPDAMNNYPADVMKANFIGALNLLDYSLKCSNCRFMFVSSSEVYGENKENIDIFTEDMPGTVEFSRFRACYPESKKASETLCHCYRKQYGVDFVIVRPAFIYGKNIIDDNTRADVYFLRQGLNREDIIMFSKGEQIRSYCYVKDCISGMLTALLKGKSGETYNISNNDCVVTLREYAEHIADIAGVNLIIDESKRPRETVFLNTTRLVLDTAKLEKLGWKPCFSLQDGLNDIFYGDN